MLTTIGNVSEDICLVVFPLLVFNGGQQMVMLVSALTRYPNCMYMLYVSRYVGLCVFMCLKLSDSSFGLQYMSCTHRISCLMSRMLRHRQSVDKCRVTFPCVPLAKILNPDCIIDLSRELLKHTQVPPGQFKPVSCGWEIDLKCTRLRQ